MSRTESWGARPDLPNQNWLGLSIESRNLGLICYDPPWIMPGRLNCTGEMGMVEINDSSGGVHHLHSNKLKQSQCYLHCSWNLEKLLEVKYCWLCHHSKKKICSNMSIPDLRCRVPPTCWTLRSSILMVSPDQALWHTMLWNAVIHVCFRWNQWRRTSQSQMYPLYACYHRNDKLNQCWHSTRFQNKLNSTIQHRLERVEPAAGFYHSGKLQMHWRAFKQFQIWFEGVLIEQVRRGFPIHLKIRFVCFWQLLHKLTCIT